MDKKKLKVKRTDTKLIKWKAAAKRFNLQKVMDIYLGITLILLKINSFSSSSPVNFLKACKTENSYNSKMFAKI